MNKQDILKLDSIYYQILNEGPVGADYEGYTTSLKGGIGSAPGGGYLINTIAQQLNKSKEEVIDIISKALYDRVFPGGVNPANSEEEYRQAIASALEGVVADLEKQMGIKIKGANASVRGYTARIISSLGAAQKEYGGKVTRVEVKQAVKEAEKAEEPKAPQASPAETKSEEAMERVPAKEADTGKEMELSEYSYSYLLDKVEELNSKAVKKKLPQVRVEKISEREIPRRRKDDSYSYKDTITMVKFKILLPEIKLPGGWKFVATVEHMDNGNIITKVPDSNFEGSLHDLFGHSKASICDHCGKVRRRTSTYIIENDKGQLKRVGKQCLKDYLGSDSASKIIAMAEYLDAIYRNIIEPASSGELNDDEMGGGFGGRAPTSFPVSSILKIAIPAVQTLGYNKKQSGESYGEPSDKTPTVDIIKTILTDGKAVEKNPKLIAVASRAAEQQDNQEVDKLVRWAEGYIDSQLKNGQPNMADYFNNLKTILQAGFVKAKYIGLIASLVPQYNRAMEKEAAAKAPEKAPGQFVGKEGDVIGELKPADARKMKKEGINIDQFPYNGPIKLTATKDTQGFERQSYSYYDSGMSFRTNFEDEFGNQYVLWSSNLSNASKGDKFILKRGKIKAHKSWTPQGSDKEIKQNILSGRGLDLEYAQDVQNESSISFSFLVERLGTFI